MIGDWVYNKNTDKPMQVYPMMLSQMFRRTPDATTEDYNIFPVSITLEILKKNGFTKHAYGFSFQYFKLYGNLRNDDTVYFTITINGEDITIDYIHQLQHAMRICGIDKEIEL